MTAVEYRKMLLRRLQINVNVRFLKLGTFARLSLCASQLHLIAKAEEIAYAEARIFGAGGDCDSLIGRRYRDARQDALRRFGFTAQTFDRELQSRLSPRAVYNLGYMF